jgi:hydrogenase nickel incorporation protein HypB
MTPTQTPVPVGQSRVIEVHRPLLGKNAARAAANRDAFRRAGVRVVNLLASPGAGKTALLERTLADLAGELRMGVVVGDLATDNDARRLEGKGAPVVQITTGTVCHLEADMVARAAAELDLGRLDLLLVENVGNLVCPAAFDLGETARVLLLASTEGEDKPLKYPVIYRTADLVMFTKADVAAAVGCDPGAARRNAAQVAPHARWLELSARDGTGMSGWYDYLRGLPAGSGDGT